MGVAVKRSEVTKTENSLASIETQPIDINMDPKPFYRSRGSLGSIEDNVSNNQNYLSDFALSECSSDTESGRFPQAAAVQYDA